MPGTGSIPITVWRTASYPLGRISAWNPCRWAALQNVRKGSPSAGRTAGCVPEKGTGKTILSRAPSMLISAIDRKLGYVGLCIKKIDTWKVKASQYDHKSNTYKKKPLSQRWASIGDDRVQRDLYSAFLIMNTTDSLDGIDRPACQRRYRRFKDLHDAEVRRLQHPENSALRWYIA